MFCFVFSHLICSVDIWEHMALWAQQTGSLVPRARCSPTTRRGKRVMNDTARQGKRENEWGDTESSSRVIRGAQDALGKDRPAKARTRNPSWATH